MKYNSPRVLQESWCNKFTNSKNINHNKSIVGDQSMARVKDVYLVTMPSHQVQRCILKLGWFWFSMSISYRTVLSTTLSIKKKLKIKYRNFALRLLVYLYIFFYICFVYIWVRWPKYLTEMREEWDKWGGEFRLAILFSTNTVK